MNIREYNELRSFSRTDYNKQIILPPAEYAMVMSEFNSNMSDEERKHRVVSKAIGNYGRKLTNMEIRRELMKELKNLYDNEDFVCSTVDIARTEDAWNTILDYIRTAKLNGDNVTSDEIQLIAIRLREENDDCERVNNQVVAAI